MKERRDTRLDVVPGSSQRESGRRSPRYLGSEDGATPAETLSLALLDEIAGDSPQIRFLKQCIERAASSEATILISGETGTGKELFARRAHRLSNRRRHPLVSVNCSAIPDGLLESELFGFEKGAFTGAMSRHEGILLQAHRSTLFLDEIGDLSLAGQAKLLRVLEQKEIRLLGSRGTSPVDVRIVAATNRDLAQLVAQGKFREDLFFRINVIHIWIPPLRERQEDIPAIANHFLRMLSFQYHRPVPDLTAGASGYLKRHPWNGNVRELRNVIERIFVFATSEYITEGDVAEMCHFAPDWNVGCRPESLTRLEVGPKNQAPYRTSHTEHRRYNLRSSNGPEQELIRKTLEQTKWNKSRAAKMLQCSRMTIYRKVIQYGLQPPISPYNEECVS
jgi:transcriptional regulator with PAS, ATPase and Fis domain